MADARAFTRLALLSGALGLLLWGFAPYALGWRTTVIISDSMTPAIRQGDLVVIMPVDRETIETADLRGAVVQVDDPFRPGRLIVHRVVNRDPDGALVTKGDANATADHVPSPPEAVRGVARLRVPAVGLPVLWLTRREAVPLGALAVVLLVLLWPERRGPSAAPPAAPPPAPPAAPPPAPQAAPPAAPAPAPAIAPGN